MAEDDLNNLFEYLILKSHLYMVHKIRSTNQNTAIKDVMVKLNDCSYFFLVVVDSRIKSEMVNHHDDEVKDFGKRGLSLHVALVF